MIHKHDSIMWNHMWNNYYKFHKCLKEIRSFWNIFTFYNTYLHVIFFHKYISTTNINIQELVFFKKINWLGYVLPYYVENFLKFLLNFDIA